MSIRIIGATSGFTEINAPAVAGSNTLVLPGGNGTARQILMGDGAGTLSFVNDAGALFFRLNADLAGANVATAQNIFGVGVTLAASTVYAFDFAIIFTKSAGTTSHTIGIGYGGTATLNNIAWRGEGVQDGGTLPFARNLSTQTSFASNSTANLVVSTASTAAGVIAHYRITGTVSINGGGTFVPQYTLSAAPGGAYSTVAGSYIRFVPIGAAGSNSSQGTWS